jgi:hypothetical protein
VFYKCCRSRSHHQLKYEERIRIFFKELSPIGIEYLTQLFNAILLTGYFSSQWKLEEIIFILKPGKPPNELTSYLPMSLLPIASKHFEKLLKKKKATRYGRK